MSEQDAAPNTPATPDTPDTPPMSPQRRISGLLIISILLTLIGAVPNRMIFIPFIGPVGGLITAFVAKRKMKVDPMIIGPRLALFCILLACLALPWNGYLAYITHNPQMMGRAFAEKYVPLIQGLIAREYDKAYEVMDESYREAVTLEEFTARTRGIFPGTEKIPAKEVKLQIRDKEMGEELDGQLDRLQKGEITELVFIFPWKIMHGELEAPCDMQFEARRIAWGEYEAKLLDFTLLKPFPVETPEAPEEPTDTPEKPADGPESPAGEAPEGQPK